MLLEEYLDVNRLNIEIFSVNYRKDLNFKIEWIAHMTRMLFKRVGHTSEGKKN